MDVDWRDVFIMGIYLIFSLASSYAIQRGYYGPLFIVLGITLLWESSKYLLPIKEGV